MFCRGSQGAGARGVDRAEARLRRPVRDDLDTRERGAIAGGVHHRNPLGRTVGERAQRLRRELNTAHECRTIKGTLRRNQHVPCAERRDLNPTFFSPQQINTRSLPQEGIFVRHITISNNN